MKLIKTEEAVGHVLCHDITQIIKGVTKDAVFRKGHIVTEEDIPVLLSVGKENLYVWEKQEGMLHENDAAEVLCEMCKGDNLSRGGVKEGKIELFAECDGLLKIDADSIYKVNSAGEMMVATRHGNTAVRKGDKIAGTRIIPLIIEEEKLLKVRENAAKEPYIRIMPFVKKRTAIITTGSEVYKGRIKDTFTPVIEQKLAEYGSKTVWHTILDDDHEAVTAAIHEAVNIHGADLVICTGGMSVDPDDRTPLAIKNTGAKIVTYGAPVLPGAMFMLAYYEGSTGNKEEQKDNIAVLGLPGCVMYAGRTIFDLVLPRIFADDIITAQELAGLGVGGLCLSCEVCTYPNCGFGKGSSL